MNESALLDMHINELEQEIKQDAAIKTMLVHENKSIQLVPGRDCLLSTVSLNVKNKKDLDAALPYAMEEKLAEPVESLHFVAGKQNGNNEYPVLIVSHEKMRAWCNSELAKADILLPEVLVMPADDTNWCVFIEGDRALVRCGAHAGFECLVSQLAMQLNLQLKNNSAAETINVWLDAEDSLPEFSASVQALLKAHQYQGSFENWIQDHFSPVSDLNLLSGQYGQQHANSNSGKRWLPAIAIALIALFTHSGLNWQRVSVLEAEIAQLNDQTNTLFQEAFPDVKRIVNVRVQSEQKLKEMQAQLADFGNDRFFSLFMDVVDTTSAVKGMSLDGFNWKQGQLQLKLITSSVTDVENLERQLSEQGYAVDIINALNKDGRILAQLKIREPAR